MRSMLARTLVLIPLLLAPVTAGAEEVYFSMLHLQGNSRLFAQISAVSQKNNDRIQREVVTTGRALDGLGDGLEAAKLHVGAAPQDLATRHADLAQAFDEEWAAINAFVDQLVLDTDRAFTEALALHVSELEEAEGVAVGTCDPPAGVLGMAMGQNNCEGRDVTAHLAAAIDADETLTAAVADICDREWPGIRPQRQAVAPLTLSGEPAPEATSSFSPQRIYERAEPFETVVLSVEEAFRAASRELQTARELHEANRRMYLESQAALTEEEVAAREAELAAELDQVKAASESLTAWRTRAVAGAVALAWSLVGDREGAVARELGVDAIGVCLQPADLGGCSGPDVTDQVAEYLDGQKKVHKEVGKHAETVGEPDLGL